MHVSKPLLAGLGTAAIVGVGSGIALTKVLDGVAERNPEGSDADGPAEAWSWSTVGVGVAASLGSLLLVAAERTLPAAITAGIGVGLLAGGFTAGLSFGSRHGVGVETEFDRIMGRYDDGDDGKIHLDDGGFWKGLETKHTQTHTVSSGKTTSTYVTTTSMARLGERADVDEDRIADSGELHDTIAGYDADGNGRLQGAEQDRYEREVGEE